MQLRNCVGRRRTRYEACWYSMLVLEQNDLRQVR